MRSIPSNGASHGSSMTANASRYLAQLKSCEMRYVILKNELDETLAEEALLAKRKSKIKSGKSLEITFWCIYHY